MKMERKINWKKNEKKWDQGAKKLGLREDKSGKSEKKSGQIKDIRKEKNWLKNSRWNKKKPDQGAEKKKNQAEVQRYLATVIRRYCSSDKGYYIRARQSLASAPSNNS